MPIVHSHVSNFWKENWPTNQHIISKSHKNCVACIHVASFCLASQPRVARPNRETDIFRAWRKGYPQPWIPSNQ
ncbi:UNVERIFIED_CONTAM: hypothetical protein FKN15_069813 [Acipenser sinensis]